MSISVDASAMTSEELAALRTNRVPRWIITTLSVLISLTVWEYFGRDIDPLFGTYPSAIFVAGIDMLRSGELQAAFLESVQPFIVGYLTAAAVGIPCGLLLGRYRFFESAFGIYVFAGFSTPLIALVPVLILWFGLGFTVKVVIIFLLSFFPVCINTWLGVKAVPKALIEVGVAFVASQRAIMRRIVLPAVLPYIMAGLRLSVGKGVIAMVIAEFLTAISGLGGLIINSAQGFRTAEMFVPIIVIMVFAVSLSSAIGWLERKIAPWQDEMAGDPGM